MSESLKNSQEFSVVYRNGKSYANKYLIMYIVKNELSRNRIGISVSKKVGNSVVRHRVTRLIRESYRLNEATFNDGLDIVVVARAGAKGKEYREINSAMLHLAKLHHILKEKMIVNDETNTNTLS
ncbi:MAG: ribonuclease P protein component [Lachnospiraceae bacterium]|nr:ribonuclease P protein component [Lachnospiraceae bacterium]